MNRSRFWFTLWLVALIVVFSATFLGTLAHDGKLSLLTYPFSQAQTSSATPTSESARPVATPTKPTPAWMTIHSFRGHLSGGHWYDSPYFAVPDHWRVAWICASDDASLPLVTIAAYDHSGNPIAGDDNVAAHGLCSDLAGTGSQQQHGGVIRLHIYAQGDWTVQVQALK